MKERWPEMLDYQQKVQAMTDLERAQAVLHEVSLARSPVKAMVAILAAARREGAEAERAANAEAKDAIVHIAMAQGAEGMRERAKAVAASAYDMFGDDIAAIIGNLPLTPEEPA